MVRILFGCLYFSFAMQLVHFFMKYNEMDQITESQTFDAIFKLVSLLKNFI